MIKIYLFTRITEKSYIRLGFSVYLFYIIDTLFGSLTEELLSPEFTSKVIVE